MTDLGEISHYLNIEVDNDIRNKIITLCQFTYLRKVLKRYDMKDATLIKILMLSEILNSLNSNSNQTLKKIII